MFMLLTCLVAGRKGLADLREACRKVMADRRGLATASEASHMRSAVEAYLAVASCLAVASYLVAASFPVVVVAYSIPA